MDTDVYPSLRRSIDELGSRSRRRDRRLRHRRCRRRGRGGARRRRRPRPRTHRRLGWRRRRWPADSSTSAADTAAKGLRIRRFRRQHGRVPECGDGAGRRREPDRRLLRRQRRSFRLAGRVRRAVQGRSSSGEPGWEPTGDEGLMYSGGENSLPFNTIATPAPRGHVPQMVEQEAGRSQRRLHADEAARRHRDGSGRASRCTTSGCSA